MEKIPTAEALAYKYAGILNDRKTILELASDIRAQIALHVKAALKAASEKATVSMRHTRPFSEKRPVIDKESILSAYPESNIK